MSETTNIRRHVYGPLYWVPVPVGLLATFYAGISFQTFWDTGRLDILAWTIFTSSLGITLVTAGIPSYTVAAVNALFTVLNVIVVARSGQWFLMYLPFMSAVGAVSAHYGRSRHASHIHDVSRA